LVDAGNGVLVSASYDNTIKVWDLKTGNKLFTFDKLNEGHSDSVRSLTLLDKSQNIVASGSKDGQIKIWDIESGRIMKTISASKSWISSIAAIEPNYFVTGSFDNAIMCWAF
jgi:WD40 repeat protein